MKIAIMALSLTLALASSLWAQDEKRIRQGDTSSELEIKDVQVAADGSATGVVQNNSQTAMRDIKLLVKHTWYWRNERNPGEDSPGRSAYVTVPGEIPAGGSMPFSYTAKPPLPQRSDGTFKTTVTVQEFTQVGG
jgi:hypothetical protein